MKKFVCPVCGFDGLMEPPYGKNYEPSHEICCCCGYEFGFDECREERKWEEYRASWINQGCPWFDQQVKPQQWDVKAQLDRLRTKGTSI